MICIARNKLQADVVCYFTTNFRSLWNTSLRLFSSRLPLHEVAFLLTWCTLLGWGTILCALGTVVRGHWFMASGDDCFWQGYKYIWLINNMTHWGFLLPILLHFLYPSYLEADKSSWFSDHDLYRWKTCFTIEPRSQSFFVCLFFALQKIIFSFPFSVLKPPFLCLFLAERMLDATTSVFMTIVKKNLQFFPWKLKCCLVTAWKITSLKDRSFSNRLPGIIIEIILQYK